MKNRKKYLVLFTVLFTIVFTLTSCSGLFEFKPYFTTLVYNHRIYGIIENGKINRMGISRDNVNKMNHIISTKYGIKFNTENRIYANEDSRTYYNIKFYNDLKFILNGKEYIIPKEKIPPLLFKKTYYRVLIKSYGGSEDIYYNGWAEDYPKDPSTLKKIY